MWVTGAGMANPAAAAGSHQSFTDLALEQLRTWPALQIRAAGRGAAVGIAGSAAKIAYLRRPDEVKLFLSRPVIHRLSAALTSNGQVHAEPDSDWIQIRLSGDSDVRLLLSLVSLAIQTSSGRQAERR